MKKKDFYEITKCKQLYDVHTERNLETQVKHLLQTLNKIIVTIKYAIARVFVFSVISSEALSFSL